MQADTTRLQIPLLVVSQLPITITATAATVLDTQFAVQTSATYVGWRIPYLDGMQWGATAARYVATPPTVCPLFRLG